MSVYYANESILNRDQKAFHTNKPKGHYIFLSPFLCGQGYCNQNRAANIFIALILGEFVFPLIKEIIIESSLQFIILNIKKFASVTVSDVTLVLFSGTFDHGTH